MSASFLAASKLVFNSWPLCLLHFLQPAVGDAGNVQASTPLHEEAAPGARERGRGRGWGRGKEEAADGQRPLQREPGPPDGESVRGITSLCQV